MNKAWIGRGRSLLRCVFSAVVISYVGVLTAAADAVVRADVPTLKVGDRWKFEQVDRRTGLKEGDYVRQITSISSTQIEGTENDVKMVMTPELNLLESSTTVITGDSRGLSFPMTVGKTWEYKYAYVNKLNPTKGRWQVEAKVVAFEKIRVKAGEFDAFKIEYSGFWNNDSTGRSGRLKITNWYAPSARCIVQNEYNDGFNDRVRQLVEFELQP